LIAKFPETALFRHVKVADGRVWMPRDATADFCGDLTEAEQQIVWATAATPSTELFGTKTAGVAPVTILVQELPGGGTTGRLPAPG
jgi:hypothetical protein